MIQTEDDPVADTKEPEGAKHGNPLEMENTADSKSESNASLAPPGFSNRRTVVRLLITFAYTAGVDYLILSAILKLVSHLPLLRVLETNVLEPKWPLLVLALLSAAVWWCARLDDPDCNFRLQGWIEWAIRQLLAPVVILAKMQLPYLFVGTIAGLVTGLFWSFNVGFYVAYGVLCLNMAGMVMMILTDEAREDWDTYGQYLVALFTGAVAASKPTGEPDPPPRSQWRPPPREEVSSANWLWKKCLICGNSVEMTDMLICPKCIARTSRLDRSRSRQQITGRATRAFAYPAIYYREAHYVHIFSISVEGGEDLICAATVVAPPDVLEDIAAAASWNELHDFFTPGDMLVAKGKLAGPLLFSHLESWEREYKVLALSELWNAVTGRSWARDFMAAEADITNVGAAFCAWKHAKPLVAFQLVSAELGRLSGAIQGILSDEKKGWTIDFAKVGIGKLKELLEEIVAVIALEHGFSLDSTVVPEYEHGIDLMLRLGLDDILFQYLMYNYVEMEMEPGADELEKVRQANSSIVDYSPALGLVEFRNEREKRQGQFMCQVLTREVVQAVSERVRAANYKSAGLVALTSEPGGFAESALLLRSLKVTTSVVDGRLKSAGHSAIVSPRILGYFSSCWELQW